MRWQVLNHFSHIWGQNKWSSHLHVSGIRGATAAGFLGSLKWPQLDCFPILDSEEGPGSVTNLALPWKTSAGKGLDVILFCSTDFYCLLNIADFLSMNYTASRIIHPLEHPACFSERASRPDSSIRIITYSWDCCIPNPSNVTEHTSINMPDKGKCSIILLHYSTMYIMSPRALKIAQVSRK